METREEKMKGPKPGAQSGDSVSDWLFDAVEKALAPAPELAAAVVQAVKDYRREHGLVGGKLPHTARRTVGEALVASFAFTTAKVGAASSMTGVIPGLGTILATCGGAAADAVLCMKYEVDMVRALAYLYGHDLSREDSKKITFFVTGLAATQDAAKAAGQTIDPQLAVNLVRKGADNLLVYGGRELFKKVGASLTGKALSKAIPFGIGMAFGYHLNKAMTNRVGRFALDYFEAELSGAGEVSAVDLDRARAWILGKE